MKKDILTLYDLTAEDFETLFKRAFELKERRKRGITENILNGKILGLLFDKPSTRTRISFEAAMIQMGGAPVFISSKDTQMVRNEPVKDTARVLSRYLDCVAIRTFSQDLLEAFGGFASIPVINALTDLYHPCQVLSDIMTIIEFKGGYEGLKIAWVGDGNNVAHSWINAAAVLGLDLSLGCPENFEPNPDIMARAMEKNAGKITVTTDPIEAVQGADVIYTDVWASMGQENESASRKSIFAPFQVNDALVAHAADDVILMHCLPAHREEEMSEAALEGPKSAVWDQSENKLHMHKAVLEILLTETSR